MTLPEKKSKRGDLTILSSDPERGTRQLRRLSTLVMLAVTALIFGWLIVSDYRFIQSDPAVTAGWTDFAKLSVLLFGAGLVWLVMRYWTPKVLGTWVPPLVILGVGWFARGFFESAMADPASRQGFYTGGRMLIWLILGFVCAWAVVSWHRRRQSPQTDGDA